MPRNPSELTPEAMATALAERSVRGTKSAHARPAGGDALTGLGFALAAKAAALKAAEGEPGFWQQAGDWAGSTGNKALNWAKANPVPAGGLAGSALGAVAGGVGGYRRKRPWSGMAQGALAGGLAGLGGGLAYGAMNPKPDPNASVPDFGKTPDGKFQVAKNQAAAAKMRAELPDLDAHMTANNLETTPENVNQSAAKLAAPPENAVRKMLGHVDEFGNEIAPKTWTGVKTLGIPVAGAVGIQGGRDWLAQRNYINPGEADLRAGLAAVGKDTGAPGGTREAAQAMLTNTGRKLGPQVRDLEAGRTLPEAIGPTPTVRSRIGNLLDQSDRGTNRLFSSDFWMGREPSPAPTPPTKPLTYPQSTTGPVKFNPGNLDHLAAAGHFDPAKPPSHVNITSHADIPVGGTKFGPALAKSITAEGAAALRARMKNTTKMTLGAGGAALGLAGLSALIERGVSGGSPAAGSLFAQDFAKRFPAVAAPAPPPASNSRSFVAPPSP